MKKARKFELAVHENFSTYCGVETNSLLGNPEEVGSIASIFIQKLEQYARKSNLKVGDREGVSDAKRGRCVGGQLASDAPQQVLQLAGHHSLALLQLSQVQRKGS